MRHEARTSWHHNTYLLFGTVTVRADNIMLLLCGQPFQTASGWRCPCGYKVSTRPVPFVPLSVAEDASSVMPRIVWMTVDDCHRSL